MAYIVKYNDEYLFDPYTNDDAIYDVKLSAEVNAAAYFDFSIPCTHHLYDKIAERDGIVRVYSDKKLLFIGEITEISDDFNQNKTVSCVDPRDHLDDVMIRPYSTVEGEEPLLAPSSIDGYFQWLVDQYNNGMINAKFHFQVGVNQGGSLTKSNYIYKKNEGLPGVGSEIENEILDAYGGYLTMTYPEGTPTLNLYSDVHEANTQIIDFGVNLIDFTRTTSTTDQYTAIRPVGGTPEKTDDDPDDYRPKPVTIEGLTDGTTSVDSDYVKNGDVVYCISKVNRYGYREYNWTESDTLDANTLLEEAIADLKKQVEPKITIDVKAVDLALFMEDYDHLECGEVARIRSKPHGVDEYLLVSSMDINLQDPSQTSYTLGRAYDSLTGEQSAYVKSLNSGINSSLDAVAGLDQTVKDQATKVDQAVTDAGNALDTANDAKDTANTAKDTADNAQQAAEDAQTSADNAQQAADAAQDTADAAKNTANEAKDTADNAQQVAKNAQELVQNIQQTVTRIDQDLEETSNKAQDAYDKADQLAGTIETVQTDIQGLEGEVDGLTVTVTGAAEDASSALKQVAQTQTDLSGFKTSVSQTYSTKTELEDAITQEVADRNAAIQVGIDGISSTVSSNYTELTEKVNAAQSDADDALAAAQTASEDLAEFTGTITGELSDLQSQIDGSIQTWFYNGVPTTSNVPASDWTTDDLKNNHLGDLYYDLDTGYAYRFMVQNGIYSWSRLADSDVTTALQNAAKAQDTADSKRRIFVTTPTPPYDVGDLWVQGSGGDIKRCQTAKTSSQSYAAADWVLASKYTDDSALDDYKDVVATTYATKSSLTQTANEIRAEVSESYQVKGDYATSDDLDDAIAQEVLDRNSAISQSATQIQQTVSQTYTTKTEASAIKDKADAAQSTANTANSNASKAQTAASDAQNTANAANSTANSTRNDLDAYKTTVSNTYATKSSVTQTANSIKSEVAAEYTTKTEFEGLEIGGTNLLLGTAYKNLSHVTVRGNYGTVSIDNGDTVGSRTSLKLVTTQAGASGAKDVMHDLVPKLENKKVVVSFWVKGSVAASMMVRVGGGYTAGSTAMDKAVTTSWSRVVVEMGPLSGNGSFESYVIITFNKAGTFRVSGMKCEYGNRATDWSPAPEDMATTDYVQTTYATKSSLEQTEKDITSSVEAKYLSKTDASSTYATKTQLKQTENSITTTVSQVQTIADKAFAKASQVEQTADGIQVTLTEVEATANSAKSTATNAQNTANAANSNATTAKNNAATALNRVTLKDTRDDNQNPQWYFDNYPKQQVQEFKRCSAIGLSGVGVFCYLTTYVPWSDDSGGCPKQTAKVDSTGKEYWRSGTSATAWSAWVDAYGTATNAAKTATNYLKFDSNGLCVGDQTTGTLGKNVLIDANSVDIRNGTTVLSSFGPDYIEIGKNSISSTIGMVRNAFEISANTSDGNTNVVVSSNPSATDKGVGTLELNSSNVGTARTKIKLGNTSVDLIANEVSIFGNLKVSGVLLYKPTLIWSGTWTSGSISIPSLSTYDFFYIGTNSSAIGYYGLIGHRSIGKNTIEAMNVVYEAGANAWHLLNFRADVISPTTIAHPVDWGSPIKDAWVNKSGWEQWLPTTEIYGII